MTSIKSSKFQPLANPDFRTKMSVAYVEGESRAYMKCEVIVDASVEEVAAYNFNFMSRKRVAMKDRKEVLLRESTPINNHSHDR